MREWALVCIVLVEGYVQQQTTASCSNASIVLSVDYGTGTIVRKFTILTKWLF